MNSSDIPTIMFLIVTLGILAIVRYYRHGTEGSGVRFTTTGSNIQTPLPQ